MWWRNESRKWDDDQHVAIWEPFPQLPLYKIVKVPVRRIEATKASKAVFLAQQRHWRFDDDHRETAVGSTPVRAFWNCDAAAEYRDERNQTTERYSRRVWENPFDYAHDAWDSLSSLGEEGFIAKLRELELPLPEVATYGAGQS